MIRDHLQAGTTVFSVIHGFGKVEWLNLNNAIKFPIGIIYDKSKETISYHKDGRKNKNDLYREIYTLEEMQFHKLTFLHKSDK